MTCQSPLQNHPVTINKWWEYMKELKCYIIFMQYAEAYQYQQGIYPKKQAGS